MLLNFNSRVRKQGESIATYIAELKRLSEHCEFAGILEDMLCDRLVCGINDSHIQHRLLAEPDLNYKNAYELVLALEAADKSAQDLQVKSYSVNFVKLPSKDKSSEAVVCHRCGGPHKAPECSFQKAKCHKCGKVGHIAKVCHSKAKPPKPTVAKVLEQQHSLQLDDQSSDSEPELPEYGMHHVTGSHSNPMVATIEINNSKLQMEIDTGASRSIIGEDTFNQLWPEEQRPTIIPAKVKLRTYTGELIPILDVATVTVNHHNQCKVLEFDHDWLHELKLYWTTISTVYKLKISCSLSSSSIQLCSMMRLGNSKE